MHPVNKLLSLFGLQVSRTNTTVKQIDEKEREFRAKYEHYYKQVENNTRGFIPYKAYRYQAGEHPIDRRNLDCEFAAYHIHKAKPTNILDIGSFRIFIIGMLIHYNVTTIDIRKRKSILENERVITCDAKALDLPDNSFCIVLSLASLPHFGLGRYGDEFDLEADIKAFNEMRRVLKPGGLLIFSTAITGGQPSIAFNARRNYDYDMIRGFCEGMDCIEEKFYKLQNVRFCSREELTTEPFSFDYYIGCWKKS